ncbi:MAG: helix-turn-helix transcriptional regulator [Candidatus Gastranaerophilales bacterium]
MKKCLNNTFLEKVGLKIRLIRKKKGLSQEELAEICESATAYIGTIERGIQNPSLLLLKKIADALDINICEIFDFTI